MLEDSSFSIHPDQQKENKEVKTVLIGNVIDHQKDGLIYTFNCEYGLISIVFYRSDIVRITMNPFNKPEMKESPAVVGLAKKVETAFTENEKEIKIHTNDLTFHIEKTPCRIQINRKDGSEVVYEGPHGMGFRANREVFCEKQMRASDCFYGFGEKTGYLNKRGEKHEMWNSDVYAPHNPETNALYQSIPFFITLREGLVHGVFFDNTWKTIFDMKSKSDSYIFSAEGGQLDYYVMAGPTFKQVHEQFSYLTGTMPLPPKWALGYHQSRYSYRSEEEVRELVDTFKKKNLPLDAIYLDIHYMDGYRVFTFDPNHFSDPKKLVEDLKAEGKRVVTIVDPGVKKDPAYKIYQEGIKQGYFCKYLEGDVYIDEVWPGKSAFPDFSMEEVRKWWGLNHEFYTDLGVEGIWNDMNEPAVFNDSKTMDLDVIHQNDGNHKTHKEYHNLYGFQMGRATYDGLKKLMKGRRPFLLTRAGYAGIQRYAAVWTGDNRSFWEHLQMSIPMCMNLGLSGVPFSGPDVGGFAHDTSGELLTRWTQVGAFTPFFRNHSAIDSIRQEPWAFGEPYESIIKKFIELRYKWLPHFYSLFYEASKTGMPVMKPLVMEYPTDQHTFNLYDQFMIGPNVIIAPILTPTTIKRIVYLSEGEWVNYWTDEIYRGGKHYLVDGELDTLPIFIKSGSFIAEGVVKQSTAEKNNKITFHYFYNKHTKQDSSIVFYEDDGVTFDYQKGKFIELVITCQKDADTIHFIFEKEGQGQLWGEINLIIHNADGDITILVNDNEISSFDKDDSKIFIGNLNNLIV